MYSQCTDNTYHMYTGYSYCICTNVNLSKGRSVERLLGALGAYMGWGEGRKVLGVCRMVLGGGRKVLGCDRKAFGDSKKALGRHKMEKCAGLPKKLLLKQKCLFQTSKHVKTMFWETV